MKRKWLLISGFVSIMAASLVFFGGCGKSGESGHTHDFSAEWLSDGENHWHECACGEKSDVEAHKGGTATCTEKAVCEVCGKTYGETSAHVWKTEFVSENGQHWHECSRTGCTAISEKENCSGGEATECGKKNVCEICKAEYGEPLAHSWKTEFVSENGQHWHECSRTGCTAISEKENCSGGEATECGKKNVCEICKAEYGEPLAHSWKTEWASDESNHWHECSRCGEKTDVAAHAVESWETTETGRTGKCTCGKEMISAVENVPATKITLYTVASFADKDYAVSADYAPSVTVNGKATDVTVSVNGEAAVYNAETKKINAVKAGTVTVNVNYTVADQQVAKSFEVEVVKPVLTIDSAVSYFSAIDGKDPSVDMFEYFDGKEFTAKQTYGGQENALTADSANKALLGAVTESKKATVCSITLECAEYVVVYSKVTAYTKVITDYTDFEDMRLTADKKTIEGYFILNADIDLTNADIDGDGAVTNYDTFYRYYDPKAKASTDMLTAVTDTNAGYGFVGVFDGNGHKINGFRSGNSYGFFGTVSGKSLDDMTEIKNVAFTNIQAGWSSWTKCRVLAEYAAFVKVENVYMSFNVTENWTKHCSIFGCTETVNFRFNKMIIEMSKTYESGAAGAESEAVGVFASVATTKWAAENQNVWHYKMTIVYNDMYFIAPPTANGRVMPLNQSTALTVYAANDFADIEENASVSLNATTLNPEVNASGSMKLYHWANAYRYDNYEKMKEKTTKVGNWDISSGKPVWVA